MITDLQRQSDGVMKLIENLKNIGLLSEGEVPPISRCPTYSKPFGPTERIS